MKRYCDLGELRIKEILEGDANMLTGFYEKVKADPNLENLNSFIWALSRLNIDSEVVWEDILKNHLTSLIKNITFSEFRMILGSVCTMERGNSTVYRIFLENFFQRLQAHSEKSPISTVCFARALRSFTKNGFQACQILSPNLPDFLLIENFIQKEIDNFSLLDKISLLGSLFFIGQEQYSPTVDAILGAISQAQSQLEKLALEDLSILLRVLAFYQRDRFHLLDNIL